MRDERGQTSAEYVGLILLVVAIVAAIASTPIVSGIRGGVQSAICVVTGGGCDSGGSGGRPDDLAGGSGAPSGGGGSGAPGSAGAPGTEATPSSGAGSADSGAPGASGTGETGAADSDDAGNDIPCASAAGAAKCIPGAGYTLAQRPEKLLKEVHRAQERLLNSGARTGGPELDRLKTELDRTKEKYLAAKRLARNPAVRGLSGAKKLTNPSLNDLTRRGETGADRAARAMRKPPSGALPKTGTAASGLLKAAGIAGTAFSEYENVKEDGAAKGTTETVAGVATAAAFTAGTEAACAPLDLTGVGVAVCAGAGVAAAGVGNAVGQKIGGFGYDHVLEPGYEHVVKPIAKGGVAVSKGAYDHVIKPLGDGVKDTVEKLNPMHYCC